MRITGGVYSGRRLHTPKSSQIRPMRDQVRSALFNILRDLVEGSRFLDLFAGTGSVGIEALSRGAEHVTFVDKSREAISILSENIAELGAEDATTIIRADVFNWLENESSSGSAFDLIFVGPPYYHNLAHETLKLLGQARLSAPEAVIFAEVFKKEQLESQYGWLSQIDERLYGDNKIHFYQAGEST